MYFTEFFGKYMARKTKIIPGKNPLFCGGLAKVFIILCLQYSINYSLNCMWAFNKLCLKINKRKLDLRSFGILRNLE